ncbi:MAG: hypothetical protein ABFD89_06980 [Bryobacteraceae bacterium]
MKLHGKLAGLVMAALTFVMLMLTVPVSQAKIETSDVLFTGDIEMYQAPTLSKGLRVGSTGTALSRAGAATIGSTLSVTGNTSATTLAATTSIAVGRGTAVGKLMVGSVDFITSVTSYTVNGLLPGDKIFCGINKTGGGAAYIKSAVPTTNTLTVTASADMSTTVTLQWLMLR